MSSSVSFINFSLITLFFSHLTVPPSLQPTQPQHGSVASYCSDHVTILNCIIVLFFFIRNLNPTSLHSTTAQLYLSPLFNTALFNFVSPSPSLLCSLHLNCLQILEILNLQDLQVHLTQTQSQKDFVCFTSQICKHSPHA